jgi:hypothetical protein
MDEKQFKKLMDELSNIKSLLILNNSKSGATDIDIGKCLGVSDRQVRNLLSRTGKKTGREI